MVIGKVTTIEYDRFRVRLLHSVKSASTSIKGKVYHIGNIGSYVKIRNHINDDIICEVIAIQEAERATKQNVDATFDLDSVRELIVRPIGILTKSGTTASFSLGVSIYPSIYSDVHVVEQEDLDAILTGQRKEESDELPKTGSIRLGISKSLVDYPVSIDVDKFFNIHSAVLGNSGSGKSYTIAHILQSVLKQKTPRARFILFDTNGEYPVAFSPQDSDYTWILYKPFKDENPQPDGFKNFYLPYYLLNLDEWLAFLMASDRTQRPFWDQVLQECYRFHKIFDGGSSSSKFYNYIKWKVYKMLLILSVRPGGDTGNMTDAISILSSIESMVKKASAGNNEEDTLKDLQIFFAHCKKICTFHYATNKGMLIASLPLFIAKSEEIEYIGIQPKPEKDLTYYQATISTSTNESFKQIDANEAEEVSKDKLEYGQYFEHTFLKEASELVLLEEEAKGNTRIREYTSTMFARLDFFLDNEDCSFMREGGKMNLDEYLSKTFGISIGNTSTTGGDTSATKAQLITIDLSELGSDVLELVTSVISRMLFDKRKGLKGEARRKEPIHLVLDEAHRYIKKDGNYILRENIFERIAREGRKFAYYLLVSSQRPSELSPVVLSQCANYIIHRIHNRVDLDFVTSVLPYFSDDYTTKIKQAIPGEALVFGNCVPMPLRVQMYKANPEPASKNCQVWDEWTKDTKPSSGEGSQK